MTATGGKRTNATGRSIGRLKVGKHTKLAEQFSTLPIRMMKSDAWAALGLADRLVLDRLVIEHADHGGCDNGKLPCRYEDFIEFGVRRQSIAPALRKLQALGFIRVTARGRRAYADIPASAAQYRITYLATTTEGPTHEWECIGSAMQATEVVALAEAEHSRKLDDNPRSARHLGRDGYARWLEEQERKKNENQRCGGAPKAGAEENPKHEEARFENEPTGLGALENPHSISRGLNDAA